jgi:hypothetical protein
VRLSIKPQKYGVDTPDKTFSRWATTPIVIFRLSLKSATHCDECANNPAGTLSRDMSDVENRVMFPSLGAPIPQVLLPCERIIHKFSSVNFYSQLCVIIAGTTASIPWSGQDMIGSSQNKRQPTEILEVAPKPQAHHFNADTPPVPVDFLRDKFGPHTGFLCMREAYFEKNFGSGHHRRCACFVSTIGTG